MKHPYTKLHVHLVWATFDRMALLDPLWEDRLHGAFRNKAERLGAVVIAAGGDLEHVHLVLRFSPSVTISQLVGEIKGASSHLINHEIILPQHFRWQGCYGAFTISPSHLDKVCDYVLHQKEHHAHRNLQLEWEQCFIPDEE